MAKYCKLDSRRLTFREYWNIVRGPNVIIAWALKIFGIPLPMSSEMPIIEDIRQFEVAAVDFPSDAMEALQADREQMQRLGFHSPTFNVFTTSSARTCSINLIDNSGTVVCKLMYANSGNGKIKNKITALVTGFTDGSFFVTSGEREKFKSAPNVIVQRRIKAPVLALWDAHLNGLQQFRDNKQVLPLPDVHAVQDFLTAYEKNSIEFGLQRGIYKVLSEQDAAVMLAKDEFKRTAAQSGLEHGDVLAELAHQENKSPGWTRALVILAVSILVFVGAGAARWSWKVAALLVPILLFHEFGHYIAMRIFGYRNLKMFFIPLFGAAVTGRNYNVAGWKKVIVSLMGPVPGIALGCIAGALGMFLHQPWLLKAAVLTLILNGFNLLPILPLDGGWVFHSLLFSRHYVLDTAFRIIAAILLVFCGPLLGGKMMMYVAIAMVINLPTTYRLSKIASDIRKRGLPEASPDDQNIPTETAQAIIGEVKKAFPKITSSKILAQHTLSVFETVNARPPNWWATAGFAVVHVASVVAVIVFASLFVVAQQGNLFRILNQAAFGPKHPFEPSSITVWRGQKNVAADDDVTIVATFPKPPAAQSAFGDIRNRLPATAAAETFGASLLIKLPQSDVATRKQLMTDLQKKTKDVFVCSTNMGAAFNCTFLALNETEAKAIEDEADEYLNLPTAMRLIPPWAPNDTRLASERQKHRIARHTYLQLQKARYDYDDKELVALGKSIETAQKQGDFDEAKRLEKTMKGQTEQAQKRALGLAVAQADDKEIAQLFQGLPKADSTNWGAAVFSLGSRMGQLPVPRSATTNRPTLFGLGNVSRTGIIIHANFYSIANVFEDAPAFAKWVYEKNAKDMKYDFRAAFVGGDDE